MSNYKVFVEVTARHDLQGNIRPLSVKWEDGRVFEIDRLLDVRQAASLKQAVWEYDILAGYVISRCTYFAIKVNGSWNANKETP